jgi:RHS repeat-associated protein
MSAAALTLNARVPRRAAAAFVALAMATSLLPRGDAAPLHVGFGGGAEDVSAVVDGVAALSSDLGAAMRHVAAETFDGLPSMRWSRPNKKPTKVARNVAAAVAATAAVVATASVASATANPTINPGLVSSPATASAAVGTVAIQPGGTTSSPVYFTLNGSGGTGGFIKKYTPSTGLVTAVAGGAAGSCVNASTGLTSSFGLIRSMATDGTNVYTTSGDCPNLIRKTVTSTGATSTLTTITGANYLTLVGTTLYVTTGSAVWKASTGNKPSPAVWVTLGAAGHVITPETPGTAPTALFVAEDTGSNRQLQKIVISSMAVTTIGSSTDLGLSGLVGYAGYLYDAAQGGRVVRGYNNSDGMWTNIAGSGAAGLVDATGTDAWFGAVTGVASDGTNLYVADSTNNRLRKIVNGTALPAAQPGGATAPLAMAPGTVTTAAGNGTDATVDNAAGLSASFRAMGGSVIVGSTIYVGTVGAVRTMSTAAGNAVGTLAGHATATGCVDATSGAASRFGTIADVATDTYYVYVSDVSCGIRRVSLSTGATSTLTASYGGGRLTFGNGTVYVTSGSTVVAVDRINGTASTLFTAGGPVATIASDASYVFAVDTVSGTNRLLREPYAGGAYTLVTSNNVGAASLASSQDYVYAAAGSVVRRHKKSDGTWIYVSGTASAGFADGTGASAAFSSVAGIVSDGTNLWIADSGNRRMRKAVQGSWQQSGGSLLVDPGATTTLAGNGITATTDGTGTAASFTDMGGVAIANGYAYVATAGSIRKVALSDGATTTLAGHATATGCDDSAVPTSVRFWFTPEGVVTDGYFLYTASVCGLRRTDLVSGATTTLSASVAYTDLAFGADGFLYTADGTAIHRVDPASGASTTFATLPGNSTSITADQTDLWVVVQNAGFCGTPPCSYRIYRIPMNTATATAWSQPVTGDGGIVSSGSYLYTTLRGQPLSNTNNVALLRFDKNDANSFTAMAGTANPGYQDGTGPDAWFNAIAGIGSDGTGLVVADSGSKRLRRVVDTSALPASQPASATTSLSINPGAVATFAGKGNAATVNGTGTAASFADMGGTVVVGGFSYVATAGSIRKVNLTTGAVTTLAGHPTATGCVDSTDASQVRFYWRVGGLSTDGYYLYSSSPCGLRRTSLQNGATSTIAADVVGAEDATFVGGYLYTASGTVIYKVNPNSNQYTQFATVPGNAISITSDSTDLWVVVQELGYCSGPPCWYNVLRIPLNGGAQSTFSSHVTGDRAIMSAGTYLYTTLRGESSGTNNVALLRYDKTDASNVTVAGTSASAFQDAVGPVARFGAITGIATDGTSLWIADSGNHRLRRVIQGPVGGGPTVAENPTGTNLCFPCVSNWINETLSGVTYYPVNAQYGNFFHSFNDLSVPGRGYGIALERTYNSDATFSSVDGMFGYGWSSSYGISLAVAGSTATVQQEDGGRTQFDLVGSSWVAHVPRTMATLVHNGNGTWTFVRKQTQTVTFDAMGRLTSLQDRTGYVTTVTYPNASTMVVTEPAGRTLTLSFTGAHVTSAIDSAGRSLTYSYDGAGNLTDVIDVGSGHWMFTYDGAHRMLTMRYPKFYGDTTTTPTPVVTNHYDAQGRVDWQSDPLGRTTTFDYTTVPGSTRISDPMANVMLNTYSNGVLVATTKGYGTAGASTWRFGYDPATTALSEVVDPNGSISTMYVDANGNVVAAVDALGRVTTTTYNAFNQPLTVTDPAGVTTTSVYDGAGNIASRSTPLLGIDGVTVVATRTTTYNYGGTTPVYAGDVTSIVDPNGKTWTYRYDSYGNVIKTIAPPTPENPTGNTTTFTYDTSRGWLTSTVSPKGNLTGANPADYTTTFDHDGYGRVTVTKDPLWSSATPSLHRTVKHYDANGNLDSESDANGNTAGYAYDAADQLLTVTRPDSTTLRNDYWADGSLHNQYDGANKATTYAYDPQGRLLSVTDPLVRATIYGYDPAGNLVSKQDPGGNCSATPKVGCTTRTYDAANEVVGITYSDGATPNVSGLTYDARGRRTHMTDGTGSSTWAYDSLGRLTTSTNGAGSTLGYQYDLVGRPTQLTYPGGSQVVTRGYDDAGRLASVTDWATRTTSFAYDADLNLVTTTYPNGTASAMAVDRTGAAAGVVLTGPGSTTLATLDYTRDGASQLASQTGTGLGQPAETYGYTGLEQLREVNGVAVLGYDAADNLTRLRGATLAYDDANQLTSSTPDGGSATTFGFDARGNRTSMTPPGQSTVTYGYDQANRLANFNSGAATYAYDGDGLRSSKTVSAATTAFTWDVSGGLPLVVKAGGTSYVHGPGGLPLEQVAPDGTTHWFFHDQLGSTRALTDSAGAVAGTWSYDPYGLVVATAGSATTPFGFTGEWTDAETGFVYLRARYYDPAIGQFLNRDPLESLTREPHAYAGNNPVNFTDPTGLYWGEDLVKTVVEIGGEVIGHPGDAAKDAGKGAANFGIGVTNAALGTDFAGFCGEGQSWSRNIGSATFFVEATLATGLGGASAEGGSGVRSITGYTRHGLNQAISRDGVGVSPSAILDAVRNPLETVSRNGTVRYVGERAAVVLNDAGRVITTWARSSAGWRL